MAPALVAAAAEQPPYARAQLVRPVHRSSLPGEQLPQGRQELHALALQPIRVPGHQVQQVHEIAALQAAGGETQQREHAPGCRQRRQLCAPSGVEGQLQGFQQLRV